MGAGGERREEAEIDFQQGSIRRAPGKGAGEGN